MSNLTVHKDLSRKVGAVSFLCACLIVCIHVPSRYSSGTIEWWFLYLMSGSGIPRIAVPFFFLFAGYFLAGHMGENGWYLSELKKRAKSLLVPMLFWGMVYFFFHWALEHLTTWTWPAGECISIVDVSSFLRAFSIHPWESGHYMLTWFLRSLMYFVALSPVFMLLKRKFEWHIILLGLFVIYGVGTYVNRDFFVYSFSLKGLFYFAVGIYLRFYKIPICRKKLMAVVLTFVSIMLWIAKGLFRNHPFWAGLIDAMAIPITMSAAWNLMEGCVLSDWRRWTFPIYMIHTFIVISIRPVLNALYAYNVSPMLSVVQWSRIRACSVNFRGFWDESFLASSFRTCFWR